MSKLLTIACAQNPEDTFTLSMVGTALFLESDQAVSNADSIELTPETAQQLMEAIADWLEGRDNG